MRLFICVNSVFVPTPPPMLGCGAPGLCGGEFAIVGDGKGTPFTPRGGGGLGRWLGMNWGGFLPGSGPGRPVEGPGTPLG